MTEAELESILKDHRLWREDSGTGKRADLSGVDLSRIDLSGTCLSRANLSGTDLRGADLTWSNLRGADLHGAHHCLRLDMVDPREYQPVAVATDAGWQIYSGCLSFGVAEALEHWGTGYEGERDIGDRYLRAIKALPECPVGEEPQS